MALFKILRGAEANLPSTLTDGWAYYCTDTSKFYIDYLDSDGKLQRKELNAKEADSLKNTANNIGSSTIPVYFSKEGNPIVCSREIP